MTDLVTDVEPNGEDSLPRGIKKLSCKIIRNLKVTSISRRAVHGLINHHILYFLFSFLSL